MSVTCIDIHVPRLLPRGIPTTAGVIEHSCITVYGVAGTNFGLRILPETVFALDRLCSDNGIRGGLDDLDSRLGISVMAAGYGVDSDWVGLASDDVETAQGSYGLMAEWAPFELTVGPTREVTDEDIAEAEKRGYFVKGAHIAEWGE
jgi:hypothetical protein